MLGGTLTRRRPAASMAAQVDYQEFVGRSRQDWVRGQVLDQAARIEPIHGDGLVKRRPRARLPAGAAQSFEGGWTHYLVED